MLILLTKCLKQLCTIVIIINNKSYQKQQVSIGLHYTKFPQLTHVHNRVYICKHNLGHTCSVVRRTKLLVRPYFIPLKADHPVIVLVTGDSDGPAHQYVLSSQ